MSYGTPLRQHVESLLLGTAGTGRAMEPRHFALKAEADASEDVPADAAERRLEVDLGRARPLAGRTNNPLDSFDLLEHDLVVRVHYALTNAGGDGAEARGEQSGPGTLDAVRDRADTDAHEVRTVLGWHENWTLASPVIVGIVPKAERPGFVTRGQTAVLEVPFRLLVNATVPGSFAP